MLGTWAWRESALAASAGQPPYQRRRESRSGHGPEAKPRPPKSLPRELKSLLLEAITRRQRGYLILGAPGAAEREVMLSEALAATEPTGPAALILPSYRYGSPDTYLECSQTADGTETVCSKRFPHLPLFASIESAYECGYRRIAVEYECDPYRPLPAEALVQCADEICFIICVKDASAEDAFAWATTSTWEDWGKLIAALCWSRLPANEGAASLYDAFVPGDRPANMDCSDQPTDAICSWRQLR